MTRRQPALVALFLAVSAAASATTYTVTSTADSGAGSLRQAITDANTNPGADTIAFAIVGSGVHTIEPTSPLPQITGPVTIDGYTQSGSSANTNPASQGLNTVLTIEIDGTNAGAAPCLFAAADDVTIRGLVVNRCTDKAVATTGAHSDFVLEGCFIGTNAAGTQALAPFGGGVNPRSQTNARIGGTTPAARNLVSGDSLFAEPIAFGLGQTEPVSNSLVAGNLVGTDITGLHRLSQNGVISINTGGGANNVVGGTTAAARNVFIDSIFVPGAGNQIQGNFVGLDVTGTIVISTNAGGISVGTSSSNNTIGGSAAGAGNRVGGTGDSAINIDGDGNVVRGNQVGTDATGTVRLANGYWGILAGVNSSNTTIGGVGPGEGNIVAYNRGYAGVVVMGVNATVRGNSIFDNAGIQANSGLAIDLTGGNLFQLGVNINDAGDADAGPNGYQNYPLISSVTYGGSNTTIAGTLNSTPSTTFDVDFYSNPACNGRPQEQDEAKTYIGSIEVTTDGSGNATFNEVLAAVVANGSPITATRHEPVRPDLGAFTALRALARSGGRTSGRRHGRADPRPGVRAGRDGHGRRRPRDRSDRRQLDDDHGRHPGAAGGFHQRPHGREPGRRRLRDASERLDRELQRHPGQPVLHADHEPRRQRHHGRRRRRSLRHQPADAPPADGGLPPEGQVRDLLHAAALHGPDLQRRSVLIELRSLDPRARGRGHHRRLRRRELLSDQPGAPRPDGGLHAEGRARRDLRAPALRR